MVSDCVPGNHLNSKNADSARSVAYEAFVEINRRGGYSNILLPKLLTNSKLDRRDRAFVTELVYGATRMIGRNDYIAAKLSKIAWTEVDPEIIDSVRLGAYQILDMRTPAHAAVSATVEVAKKYIGQSRASFVNAILRRISEKSLAEHLIDAPDDARYSHPNWIISAYKDLIKDQNELVELLECNNSPTKPTLVAWPTKSLQSELPGNPTKYSPYGVHSIVVPQELDAIRNRSAGVQDEGSQLVAIGFAKSASLQPWLDLCAGPGGKAALLSYLDPAPLYANEISKIRSDLIKQVVRADSIIWTGDGRDISDHKISFGSILADVPCTGLGALRRRPEVRWRRNPSDLPALTKLQFELSCAAIENLKPGGLFAYATCSPHLAETAAQKIAILKRYPELEIIKVDLAPELLSPDGTLQLWPHRHDTDAMYLALFRKRLD